MIAATPAAASPNVSLDDPVYDQLDQREIAGDLPAFRGGLAPLTGARVQEVLGAAPAQPGGWWARLERAALHAAVVHETARDYSTDAHPRSVAGRLALSCEDAEGRPCGAGAGLASELDAAAGYGPWISGAVRLRAVTGRDAYATALDLDRAYVNAELGPISVELGRDVLVLGPAAHTRLGWGTNAPPLDHARLSSARPLTMAPWLGASFVYVLGRLAAPQTYPGALVSLARGQLDLADRVELGAMQLLELGGDGAPGFGVWDFALEHVRRRDLSAGPSDSSNRRLAFDLAVHLAVLGGARAVYQLAFEDLRKEMISAFRHDADHAVELATRWLTIEWQKTGERAYEHMPRTTGFTSGGRIVGDPLGPAAQAVRVTARVSLPPGELFPWAQVVRLGSDSFQFGDGPIVRTSSGGTELRFRIGARARVSLGRCLELSPEAALEEVVHASFLPEARRTNVVIRATLAWRPGVLQPTARAAGIASAPW